MARPRLDIGEWGKITTTQLPDGRYRARCRFRGIDGKVRPAEALANSKPKAERALKARVQERVGDRDSELGGDTRLKVLAGKWWETVEQRCAAGDLNPDTRREYQRYRDRVIDACGELAIRECTPGRLLTAITTSSGDSVRVAAEMKRTLVGMFDYAMDMDAMEHNPAVRLQVGRGRATSPRALTFEEIEQMRALIHAYENSGGADAPRADGRGRGGRPRSRYLSDLFDLQLALGCRIGELLALRWDHDVHGLAGENGGVVTVEISGTLKHRSTAEAERLGLPAGLYRQANPKTAAGHRVVTVPSFGVVVLRRLAQARGEGVEWVLSTSRGTPLSPSNVRTALRKARGEKFDWVTPHTLRRTTATIISDKTGSAQAASLVLGHASTMITERAYVDRSKIAPDMSRVVEHLAPKVTHLPQKVG